VLASEPDSGLPDAPRPVPAEAAREIGKLETRIRAVERSLEGLADKSPFLERLRSMPGVGALTPIAFVALLGDVQPFLSGRHPTSYLGLTLREGSSWLRQRLGAIRKRGNPSLRMLLSHGARSVLLHVKKATVSRDHLRTWALAFLAVPPPSLIYSFVSEEITIFIGEEPKVMHVLDCRREAGT
jgi:transposase